MRFDYVFVVAPQASSSAQRVQSALAQGMPQAQVRIISLLDDEADLPAHLAISAHSLRVEVFVRRIVDFVIAGRVASPSVALVCVSDRMADFTVHARQILARDHAGVVDILACAPAGQAKLSDKTWLEEWRREASVSGVLKQPALVVDLLGADAPAAIDDYLAGFPPGGAFVIKPARGTVSTGVKKFLAGQVRSEEIAAWVLNAIREDGRRYVVPLSLAVDESMDCRAVVQPHVAGVELAIDGFVGAGRCDFILHRKLRYARSALFARDEILVGPHGAEPGAAPLRAALKAIIEDVFRAAGLGAWLFHAEAIVTPKGEIFVLEVHPRPAGGLITQSVEWLCGVDMHQALAPLLQDRSPPALTPTPGRHTCELTIYPRRSGIVSSVRGVRGLPSMPGYVTHKQYVAVGRRVQIEDHEEYGLNILIEGCSPEEALIRARAALRAVRIETRVEG